MRFPPCRRLLEVEEEEGLAAARPERGRGGNGSRVGEGCPGNRGERRNFGVFSFFFRVFPIPRREKRGPLLGRRVPAEAPRGALPGCGGFPDRGEGHAALLRVCGRSARGSGFFLTGTVRSCTAIRTPAVGCTRRRAGMRGGGQLREHPRRGQRRFGGVRIAEQTSPCRQTGGRGVDGVRAAGTPPSLRVLG